MKRALVVALSAALLTTLFGGLASADSASTVHPQAEVVVDSQGEDAPHNLWQRCRRLLGEDQLSDAAYEKCVELWKRWCKAHPRARRCPRPDPPPRPCKVVDRVIDECVPCRVVDRVTDVRRPCPEPPPPCQITDAVTDRCCKITDRATDLRPCPEPPPPCTITDAVTDRCCEITDRATDLRLCPEPPKPPPCPSVDAVSDIRCEPCLTTDVFAPCPTPIPIPLPIPCETVDSVVKCRPCVTDGDVIKCIPDPCLATDAAHSRLCVPPNCELSDAHIKCDPIPPTDRPADKPIDRPTDKPADTRPTDEKSDRLTDRKGNDVHLRTVDADS